MLSRQLLRSGQRGAARRTLEQTRHVSSLRRPWTVSEEVQDAVRTGKPVVALETAIYTHGFPHPENLALSSSLESLVRDNGGIPATMGILNGIVRVGMQPEEIAELLEKAGTPDVVKVSRRDLAFLCSSTKYSGGTTIAGGLVIAHLAGIKVFATGGLGGVHRDRPGETSMDISADLTELGRTPVALITSGCKSFLDIPRTLEVLETQGVCVATFADGRTGPVDWPAFWTRESGIPSPKVVRDEEQAASIIHAQNSFPIRSGLLFANPIPAKYSIPNAQIDSITAKAVDDASKNGITGNDNTPYILSRIRDLSEGATIAANRALVEANVIRGTKVAVELAKLEAGSCLDLFSPPVKPGRLPPEAVASIDVMIAGSAAIDLSCDYAPITDKNGKLSMHTSNPARVHESIGGVACNIARACHFVGARSVLCTVVGADPAAESIRTSLAKLGMDTSGILSGRAESRSARYVAVNDSNKDLVVAMADMGIIESNHGEFDAMWTPLIAAKKPRWLVVDANWSAETLHSWIKAAREAGAKVAYEPVSVEKSGRLLSNDWKQHLNHVMSRDLHSKGDQLQEVCSNIVDVATPNALEALTMSKMVSSTGPWSHYLDSIQDSELETLLQNTMAQSGVEDWLAVARASLKLLGRIPCVLTKAGSKGVLQIELLATNDPRLRRGDIRDNVVLCNAGIGLSLGIDANRIIPSTTSRDPLQGIGAVYIKHHPANRVPETKIASVNGVGDTFLGVLVAALARCESIGIEEAIFWAQKGAALTLQSPESASPDLDSLRSYIGEG